MNLEVKHFPNSRKLTNTNVIDTGLEFGRVRLVVACLSESSHDSAYKQTAQLGKEGFTFAVHGNPDCGETKKIFADVQHYAPAIVLRDIEDAIFLARFINGRISQSNFLYRFRDLISPGFTPEANLLRIAVLHQSSAPPHETAEIADVLRDGFVGRFGFEHTKPQVSNCQNTDRLVSNVF